LECGFSGGCRNASLRKPNPDPLGTVLTGPVFDQSCVLVADLDMAMLARAKYDFDPVGHYARPDIFSLTVDTAPKPPVRFVP